jgi:hypothetical protein
VGFSRSQIIGHFERDSMGIQATSMVDKYSVIDIDKHSTAFIAMLYFTRFNNVNKYSIDKYSTVYAHMLDLMTNH